MTLIKSLLPQGTQRRARTRQAVNAMWPVQYQWRTDASFNEPFFIVGSGRCGTTLLRRLLQASPDVHVPPENWAMRGWFSQFGDYRTALTWRQMCGVLMNQLLLNNQGWFECCPTQLFEELDQKPESERTLADFIDHVYRFHGNHVGSTFQRWGDKTPLNINNVKQILDIFPRAKFVFMLRDPGDVVYSWSKRRNYFDEVERPAIRWKNAFHNGIALERDFPQQVIRLRYEDLVARTEEEMGRVAAFLGVKYDVSYVSSEGHFEQLQDAEKLSHLANALNGVSQDSIGKGRRKLNHEQLKSVQEVLSDTINQSGYEPLVS